MPLSPLGKLQRLDLNNAVLFGSVSNMDTLVNGKAGDATQLVIQMRAQRTYAIGRKSRVLGRLFINAFKYFCYVHTVSPVS